MKRYKDMTYERLNDEIVKLNKIYVRTKNKRIKNKVFNKADSISDEILERVLTDNKDWVVF